MASTARGGQEGLSHYGGLVVWYDLISDAMDGKNRRWSGRVATLNDRCCRNRCYGSEVLRKIAGKTIRKHSPVRSTSGVHTRIIHGEITLELYEERLSEPGITENLLG
jgi:hypothetical protein